MSNIPLRSGDRAIFHAIRQLEKVLCGIGSAVAAASNACPPVAPTVSCSTVKCCTPTCDVVFQSTCITTEVITVPAEPGGDGEPIDPTCATHNCCGKVTFGGGAAGGGGSACTYELGEAVETVQCTSAEGVVIECPPDLIPNCEPNSMEIIPVPNPVCIAGEAEGECIENITKLIKITTECFMPSPPECYGYMVGGEMVPCEEVTEIPCPEYVVLQNAQCVPDIVIPPDCEYIPLDECPKK